jgi:hypothetical protein
MSQSQGNLKPLVSEDRETPLQMLVLLAERDRLGADLAEFFLHTEGYQVMSAFRRRRGAGAL